MVRLLGFHCQSSIPSQGTEILSAAEETIQKTPPPQTKTNSKYGFALCWLLLLKHCTWINLFLTTTL